MNGVIFDIQNYAIHDGPGIRTCVYLKGCPLRCSWCHNPESQCRSPEPIFWQERCSGCGACVAACPNGARRLEGGGIVRDSQKCTGCGNCAATCPNAAVEMAGYRIEAAELASLLERDRPFFDDSGGGVTFSGGEPTGQAGFVLEVARLLKQRGIHIAIETCGLFPKELVGELVGLIDLFLFDLKHISDQRHRLATGASNALICENYNRVRQAVGDERMLPRLPLVPGFNCDPKSVEMFVDFFKRDDRRGPVQLMPFHGWATDKYRRLGRDYLHLPSSTLSQRALDGIVAAFSKQGLCAVIE